MGRERNSRTAACFGQNEQPPRQGLAQAGGLPDDNGWKFRSRYVAEEEGLRREVAARQRREQGNPETKFFRIDGEVE